jgi:hypothetical protein
MGQHGGRPSLKMTDGRLGDPALPVRAPFSIMTNQGLNWLRLRSVFAAAETGLRLLIELTFRPFRLLLWKLGVREPPAKNRSRL